MSKLTESMAGPKENEHQVSESIRKYLKATGWLVIRNQQNIGSMKGISDFTIIKEGRVIFLEVKSERGKQSDEQRNFEMLIKLHGGEYYLIKSINELVRII